MTAAFAHHANSTYESQYGVYTGRDSAWTQGTVLYRFSSSIDRPSALWLHEEKELKGEWWLPLVVVTGHVSRDAYQIRFLVVVVAGGGGGGCCG